MNALHPHGCSDEHNEHQLYIAGAMVSPDNYFSYNQKPSSTVGTQLQLAHYDNQMKPVTRTIFSNGAQNSLPNTREQSSITGTTNHLMIRVQSQYDSVFSRATIQEKTEYIPSNQLIRIPTTYTDLAEKLPKINAIAKWSETVIRALFDTMVPTSSTHSYQYGSPEQNILNALMIEKKSETKTLAFGLLIAELEVLLELLPQLDLHPEHKQRIHLIVKDIRALGTECGGLK